MQRLRQLTFASLECDRKKRREIFPERMDGPIPWERLEASIAPACPKGGGKGRQPHPLSVMLRCTASSCSAIRRSGDGGPACEAESIRRFAGVSLEKVPDETTIPTSAAGWSAADWRTNCSGYRVHRRGRVSAREQLRGDVLGVRFQPRGAIGIELELAGEDLVDPPAKNRPVVLLDLEVSPQIEQGALAHLGADAFGTNEAMGEIRLAGVGAARLGSADEHRATVAQGAIRRNACRIFYSTTSLSPAIHQSVASQNQPNPGQIPVNHGSQG